jgi:hypothetical protein
MMPSVTDRAQWERFLEVHRKRIASGGFISRNQDIAYNYVRGSRLKDLSKRFGLSHARIHQIICQEFQHAERIRLLENAGLGPDNTNLVPWGDEGHFLPQRAARALSGYGIWTAEQVRQMSDEQLLRFYNFGRKSLYQVREIIGRPKLPAE